MPKFFSGSDLVFRFGLSFLQGVGVVFFFFAGSGGGNLPDSFVSIIHSISLLHMSK